MKLISRIVSFLLFIIFFGLAVKNTQETSLYFFFGYELRGPFVLMLLGFFAAGSILAILGMTPMIFRNKREISRMKKQIAEMEKKTELQDQNQIESDTENTTDPKPNTL